MDWVEKGAAPARIEASARPGAAYFAGRTRPLCPYPAYARYSGTGSLDDGVNFVCAAPSDFARAGARQLDSGNAERSFSFYRDVFGSSLRGSPEYLTEEFVISSQFTEEETDLSKWSPRPCDIPAPVLPARGAVR